jgi:NAD(P)H dehydrogenase (quinone)
MPGEVFMGRILVLYDSATGNTAVMAHHVAEGATTVPGIEVRLRPVEEASREDVFSTVVFCG